MNRDIVCQLPPEAGRSSSEHCCKTDKSCIRHARCPSPPSSAPDSGGTSLTKHCKVMARFSRELIDTVTCRIQYSRVRESGTNLSLQHCHDAVFEKILEPIAGSPATGKSVAGIIDLFLRKIFSEQVVGPSIESVWKGRLKNWTRFQQNKTRKISITLLQCM